jgi:hypothetical protein
MVRTLVQVRVEFKLVQVVQAASGLYVRASLVVLRLATLGLLLAENKR